MKKYLKLVEDNLEEIEEKLKEALRNSYESHNLGSGWGYYVYFDSNDKVSISEVLSQNTYLSNECIVIKQFTCMNPSEGVDDIVADAGVLDSYPEDWNKLDYWDKKEYILKNTEYEDDLIDCLVDDYDPDKDIEDFINFIERGY
jgi:hypothetical protein